MRTFSNITIIACLLSLLLTPAHARISKEFIQWAKGEFEIPADIKKVTKSSGLQAFLDNERVFTRIAAIRRLSEIDGPKSIDLLVKIFAKEPSKRGPNAFPLVKYEIIRTLGRMDTEKAKIALLNILKDYWKKGPNVKDKKGYRLDRDFAIITPLILETLYKWSDDKDVFQAVEKIALSDDVKRFYTYPNGIGQKAWEVYLKGKIVRQRIVEEKDSAKYLLDFMRDITEPLGYGTLGSIKSQAANEILKKHSEAVLSSLLREVEEEFKKQSLAPDPGTASGRKLFLKRLYESRDRRSYLRKLLKEKANQAEK